MAAQPSLVDCGFSAPQFTYDADTKLFSSEFYEDPSPASQATAKLFAGWEFEADTKSECVVPFQQAAVPMEWPGQAVPAACSDESDELLPTTALEQFWAQGQPSSGPDTAGFDAFVPVLSSSAAPSVTMLAAGPDGLPAVYRPSMQVDDSASYPLAPLDPDRTPGLWIPVPHQPHELAPPLEFELPLTGEHDLACDGPGLKRECAHTEKKDGAGKRKRGRPPIETHARDADLPRYLPPPLLQPTAAHDAGQTPSPTNDDATATLFAMADSAQYYQLCSLPLPLAADADASSPPLSEEAEEDVPPRNPKRTHSRRTSSITTTTKPDPDRPAAEHQHHDHQAQQHTRDRNRAAASRYRAKTQAAAERLEAAERAVSARHQALAARAGQLRDELFALKTEVLRHADCGCPLIAGYLSHAAERACAGFAAAGGERFGGVAAAGVECSEEG